VIVVRWLQGTQARANAFVIEPECINILLNLSPT
jgi:hypothetical protein